jgi:hypothetical protein
MFRIPVHFAVMVLAAVAVAVVSFLVAPATASAVTSCDGTVRYDAYNNSGSVYAHEYGWWWSTNGAVCIGQADEEENVTHATGLDERVRVHNGPSNGTVLYESYRGGRIDGNRIFFTTYVRRVFWVADVTVCVAVVHHSDHSVVPNTTVCKSLP